MKMAEKEIMKFVGMEVKSTVQDSSKDCYALWTDFMKRIKEIKSRVGDEMYGVCFTISIKDCSFRYLAGVMVKDFKDVPKGLSKMTVPKSRFAIFTHKGPLSKLGQTYGRIYEKDMPQSKLKQKEFWIEYYDDRFSEKSPKSEMELWVGVE